MCLFASVDKKIDTDLMLVWHEPAAGYLILAQLTGNNGKQLAWFSWKATKIHLATSLTLANWSTDTLFLVYFLQEKEEAYFQKILKYFFELELGNSMYDYISTSLSPC